MQEFNEEYDEETALGLPHGFFNPSTPLPQFQKGFLGFVVNPLFQAMNDIDGIELSKPLAYIDANIKAWEMEISEGLKAD